MFLILPTPPSLDVAVLAVLLLLALSAPLRTRRRRPVPTTLPPRTVPTVVVAPAWHPGWNRDLDAGTLRWHDEHAQPTARLARWHD